jgi:hypothetical protein
MIERVRRWFGARTPRTPEQRRTLAVALLLYLLTFSVYWTLGPQRTAFDYQLSQANNIVHGHLDLTAEYTHNLNILERVLYDGQGFCLPTNDARGEQARADLPNVRISDNCRYYMQHSLGPALLLIPLVLLFGLTVNQTLVSALLGALVAPIAFAIVRRFSQYLPTQLALTVLAVFGTTFWYSAADGGVWHLAHATAVLFLFAAIWATVVRGNPFLAGLFIGAAFMCRPTTILGGLFPLIYFASQWWDASPGVPWLKRLRVKPLAALALGAAPLVAIEMSFNWLRFGSPFESGYNYTEQLYQLSLQWRWPYGFFDLRYIPRHPEVFWERMPNFTTYASFVWPSWSGTAIWVTTPAILYAFFVHLRRYRAAAQWAVLALALGCGFMLVRAMLAGWAGVHIFDDLYALGLQTWPLWILTVVAVALAIRARSRLVLACWAAILAIVLVDWSFAATGWAQFGYRYALDFIAFAWLLVVLAVGARVRWHHLLLIGIAVLVNLWGVVWIFLAGKAGLFGWTWSGY